MTTKQPINIINQWIDEAANNPSSIVMAGCNENLRPITELIEITVVDGGGIKTNSTSFNNQQVAICIYWMNLGRQIRVEGEIKQQIITPSAIEFWQEKPFRLHDRTRFELDAGVWKNAKLYP